MTFWKVVSNVIIILLLGSIDFIIVPELINASNTVLVLSGFITLLSTALVIALMVKSSFKDTSNKD